MFSRPRLPTCSPTVQQYNAGQAGHLRLPARPLHPHPALEAEQVRTGVLALNLDRTVQATEDSREHLRLQLVQQLGPGLAAGLPSGRQGLQVRLPVQVGRHHKAAARGQGAGQQH